MNKGNLNLGKWRPVCRAAVLCSVLLSACSRDVELPGGADSGLLTLHTRMDGLPETRATAGNTWDGGEQVQVSIDGAAAVSFTAASDGTLAPAVPVYWEALPGSISARAWYPASWTMQSDQSTAAKLQSADFVFAPTVSGITAANRAGRPLVFLHRMAKITATFTAGNGISAADLTGATVSFYGYTSGSANTADGSLTGSANDWISPFRSGNVCTALLIPQDMTDTDFIRVSIGGDNYYYKPGADEAILAGGKFHNYQITVRKN
jgi:hypothetical protein